MGRPRTLDYAKIKEMHMCDCDSQEIAEAVGSDSRSVRDAIKRMGLPKRPGYPRNKYDPQAIVDAYISPMSAEKVASKIGCCKSKVFDALRELGVPTREGDKRHDVADRLAARGVELTKEYFVDLMAKHSNNASDAAVEARLPYHTFIDQLVRFNIPRNGGDHYPDFPVDEAIKMSNDGYTYAQIAEHFGVPYNVVKIRLHNEGHIAPPRGKCAPLSSATAQRNKFIAGVEDRRCVVCGDDRLTDHGHIKPKKLGGPNEPENRMMICGGHHKLYDKAPHLLTAEEVEKLIPYVQAAVERYGWWEGCLIPENKERAHG